MKYIVLLERNESYNDYCRYFTRPNVCVQKTWDSPNIYYNKLLIK